MKVIKAMFGLAVILFLAHSATALDWVGKVTEARGQVSIIRAGQTLSKLASGGILPGDEIVTGPNSQAKIWFIDQSMITLSEKSRFKVDALEYNPGMTRKSVFTLVGGKAKALVGGWFGPSREQQYQIKALTKVAGVRGTEFTVEIRVDGQNKTVYVEVISGIVTLWTAETPGQIITVPADTNFEIREGETTQQAQERQEQYVEQLAQELFGKSSSSGGGGGSLDIPPTVSPANRTEQ